MVLRLEAAAQRLPAAVTVAVTVRGASHPDAEPPARVDRPPTPALFTVHLIRPAWPCVWAQGRAGKIRLSAHKNPTPAVKFPLRHT